MRSSAGPAHVIGAGLSGLSTAWRLSEAGHDVTVSDQSGVVGGLINTTHTPWGPAEHAANAFVWGGTTADWFTRLDLTPVFARETSRRRYIYRNGRPRRWPLTIGETATTALRLGRSWATRSVATRSGETVEAWGHRVAGGAATRHLLAPALQGIYAAPLDRLSARAVFGHRRTGRVRMAAPAGGMGAFVQALHRRLMDSNVEFRLGTPVTKLDPDIPTWICTSAPTAARLLAPHAPTAASLVAQVSMAALASVTSFYQPHREDLHGFGILFPRDSGVQALGVLFNTDIFPDRGPYRSETWIHGGITSPLPDTHVLPALVAADRHLLTRRRTDPMGTHIACWAQAFPVYDEAVDNLAHIDRHLPPWLHVAGNYLGRRGVSDLIGSDL